MGKSSKMGQPRGKAGGFGRTAAAFARSQSGGMVVPFALALAPLTMLSVGAIDFNRGVNARAELQDALDAAALTVGRSSLTDPAAIQLLGEKSLKANLQLPPSTELMSWDFKLEGTDVRAKAKAKVKPMMTALFTGDKLTVSVRTDVKRGGDKLEIALVLDNTGSMSGSKLSLLKTAATNFVNTMETAANKSIEADTVKIALVPFSQTVNVGTQYRYSTWVDQNAASPINDQVFGTNSGVNHANRFTLLQNMGVAWAGCVEGRQAPYDVQETAPTTSTPATLYTPYFAPDESSGSSTYLNSYLTNDVTTSTNWKDRQGNIAKYSHAPDKTGPNGTGTGYDYGPNAGCKLQPIIRLTKDFNSIRTAITSMAAVGDTNIPAGLIWGWHVLSPTGPFADGAAYGQAKRKKIVVLMTDGQNANAVANGGNASYYSGIGYIWQNRLGIAGGAASQRSSALDGRLALLCQNLKAADPNVVVYTVRLEVNDQNFSVLQNCASTPGKFYDVQNASQLDGVFQTIASSIQNLRLSK